MDAEALNLLKRAGLNQYESKVYLALLHNGATSASDISDLASIPRPRAYDVLSKLEKMGFVTTQPGRPTKFAAFEVTEAFSTMRKQKEKEHFKSIEEVSELEKKLKERVKTTAVEKAPKANDAVWVLSNRSNIYSKIGALIENAQNSIILSSNENELKRKLDMYGDSLIAAKKRGVDVKTVSATEMKHKFNHIKTDSHRMLIADDNVLLFLTPDESKPNEEVGAWIKSSYLADNLKKMIQ